MMLCQLAARTLTCRHLSFSRLVLQQQQRVMAMHTSSLSRALAELSVTPPVALVDDPVSICITGLCSKQQVTLVAAVKEKGLHISHSHYTADEDGVVDVSAASSSGGTYTGQEPMGPFWAMVPADGERVGLRLMKKDVTKPYIVRLQVREGHVSVSSEAALDDHSHVLSSTEVERWYMAEGVKRIKIRDGRVRGTLFLPPGDGPFPGVIDMFGTAGGIVEFRAALLASRGFAAFSLPYFAYEDLPKGLEFDLEYFEEAVDFLSSHPSVKKPGIGVIGVSMGSDYAFYMAIAKKQVVACVAINGFYFFGLSSLQRRGVPFPSAVPDVTKLTVTSDNVFNFQECYFSPEGSKEAAIQVEKADQCTFLLVHSEDDTLVGPYHRDKQVERFQRHGCTNYRVLSLRGAGHLLEPPHTPLSSITFHKMLGVMIEHGGQMNLHAKGQEQSWQEILSFLREHLHKQNRQAKL